VQGSPTMLGRCAVAATAAEARFRVDYPNSGPRASRIVAFDAESAAVMRRVAAGTSAGAHLLTFAGTIGAGEGLGALHLDARLRREDGGTVLLGDELAGADVVVMIATAGSDVGAAAVIGNACAVRGIMTTALVVAGPGERPAVVATVAALRPFATMLVMATGEEYIPEMLTALRA